MVSYCIATNATALEFSSKSIAGYVRYHSSEKAGRFRSQLLTPPPKSYMLAHGSSPGIALPLRNDTSTSDYRWLNRNSKKNTNVKDLLIAPDRSEKLPEKRNAIAGNTTPDTTAENMPMAM